MVWRTKRRTEKKEDAEKRADEASPVVARVTGAKGSASAAEVAVRGALARAEIDREIDRIAIVAVGNVPFARVLGAALGRDRNARVVALDDASPDDADAALLVLAESVPEAEAEAARAKLAPILLGAVVAEDTRPPAAADLAEFAHREAALRRLTESVEQQQADVEERERALDERERALAAEAATADDTLQERVHELETELAASAERLAAALERADAAEKRVRELEEEVARLRAELEEAQRRPEPEPEPEPAPEPAPAPQAGAHNLRDLEERVVDAQVRNDPRAEEWAYYIPLLREHAALDGQLPREFDTLIESVFE